jgi:hypothetical protein
MARYPEQLIKSDFLSLDLHFYRSIPLSVVICYFHKELKYGFHVRNLNMSAKSPTLHSVALLATADLQHNLFMMHPVQNTTYHCQ